jgi:hypothetical protein
VATITSGPFKDAREKKDIRPDEEMEDPMAEWLRMKPKDFLRGIQA